MSRKVQSILVVVEDPLAVVAAVDQVVASGFGPLATAWFAGHDTISQGIKGQRPKLAGIVGRMRVWAKDDCRIARGLSSAGPGCLRKMKS
jgi:hypothetical protein